MTRQRFFRKTRFLLILANTGLRENLDKRTRHGANFSFVRWRIVSYAARIQRRLDHIVTYFPPEGQAARPPRAKSAFATLGGFCLPGATDG